MWIAAAVVAALVITAYGVLVAMRRPAGGDGAGRTKMSAARPTLAWTFATNGPVKGAAAIADGSTFFGSGDGHVYGLDLRTGRQKWMYPPAPETQPDRQPASGSATAIEPFEGSTLWHDGTVYIGGTDGVLYALNATVRRLR